MKAKILLVTILILSFFVGCNKKEETEEEKLKREIAELQEQLKEKEREIDIKEKQKENVEKQIENLTEKQNPEDPLKNPEYLISSGKTGKISIGMEINKIYDYYPSSRIKKSVRMLEGEKYDVYEIYDNLDNFLFEIEPICEQKCKVFRITIKSPKMKTNKLIGIGNNVGDLKRNYTLDEIIQVESIVVATIKNENITFVLDDLSIPKLWFQNQKIENMPEHIKITEIFVY